jgi:hypothetical protein
MLEYMYFEPGTPKNSQFIMAYFEWIDGLWIVTSIPTKYKLHAKAVTRKCGIRIADGVPTELSWNEKTNQIKPRWFPVKSNNAFHLENEEGHPMYKKFDFSPANIMMQTKLIREWLSIEDQLIKVIQGRDMQKANDFLKDWKF